MHTRMLVLYMSACMRDASSGALDRTFEYTQSRSLGIVLHPPQHPQELPAGRTRLAFTRMRVRAHVRTSMVCATCPRVAGLCSNNYTIIVHILRVWQPEHLYLQPGSFNCDGTFTRAALSGGNDNVKSLPVSRLDAFKFKFRARVLSVVTQLTRSDCQCTLKLNGTGAV